MFRAGGGTGAGADGWETLDSRQEMKSNIMQSYGDFCFVYFFLFGVPHLICV